MTSLDDAGVKKDPDGYKVIFPWGFEIVELDGEKVLQPLTPSVYRELVREETGEELTNEQLDKPLCSICGAGCCSTGCKKRGGRCKVVGGKNRWYCICVDY